MRYERFLMLGVTVLLLMSITVIAQDKDNMNWKLAWASSATLNPDDWYVPAGEVPVPYRCYNSEAWFDFDGDGNLEFYTEDQDPFRGIVYEADGDNKFVYRWHIDYFINDSTNLLNRERSSHGTDCDGDGADELIHMHTVPVPDDPNHIPPIRVFKHEPGSAQFLPGPFDWTVAWDDIPMGREDNSFRPEYYTDAGDFDNDGKGEFVINYKRDPANHFSIVEVTPPLTPEEVQFTIELEIMKEEYMKPGVTIGNGYNACRIDGEDLDNDGRAEFFLFNRESAQPIAQSCYYVDCTGPDTYDVYAWHMDDEIVTIAPHARAGENYTFIDLDGDGVKEIATYARGYTEDVGANQMALWVAKINPADPANVLNGDDWYLIATVDEMVGVEPGGYNGGGGWIEAGDGDKDGYSDIYIGAGNDGLVIDAEFVGTDVGDPAGYNFYPIISLQEALSDTFNEYHSARSAIGDGDGDGQTDIVIWNKRHVTDSENPVPRPSCYVMEYDIGERIDKNNMDWRLAWASQKTLRPDELYVPAGEVPIPYRHYNSEAWFDFDGDGNLEFYTEDQDPFRGIVYEADGDNKFVYRWHIDYFINDSTNLLNRERSSHGTDCDGDGADELIHMHTVPVPDDPNHIPPIRVFKHEAGSAQFLPGPFDWTVAWDDIPMGREDNSFRPEYYTDAGDFDNDGKGEFAINYKRDPANHFSIVEVTPPLTPEGVQFTIELEIMKEEYMKPGVTIGNGYNACRIDGEDLDNDGRAEFFLFNRESAQPIAQSCYYVDCTGPDTYDVYAWHMDDEIVTIAPHARAGENYTFIDLDGDGVKEIATYARGYTEDVGANQMALWVAKINPADPANVLNGDDWYLIATVDEMVGVEPGGYNGGGGWIEAGDGDKDGYSDIYIGAGNDGLVIDAEFVGTDVGDPAGYNFYPVISLQEALSDTFNEYHSARSAIGDGDGDGQTDIVIWNKRHVTDSENPVPRPGCYVMEYGPGEPWVPVGVEQKHGDISTPKSFTLRQNYPNPFNPTTTISYYLPKTSSVKIDIYNINGKLVKTLLDAKQTMGDHRVVWDGTDMNSTRVSSGVYFYTISVNSARSVKKMTLIK